MFGASAPRKREEERDDREPPLAANLAHLLQVGRIGAIVGPTFGGVLLAQELPLQQNFLIFSIPAAISALAMLVFAVSNARRTSTVQLATA